MLRRLISVCKKRLLISSILLLSTLFTFCLKDPDLVGSGYDDNVEFESVWQYLKAFSIYQDSSIYEGRIPEGPFIYNDPKDMFRQVADTLRGGIYTWYYYDKSSLKSANAQINLSNDNYYVSYNNVTALTGIIRITTFNEEGVYRQFLESISQIPSTNKNLIIDLRNNGGGSIFEAESIIEAFLPIGKEYIEARERNLKFGSDAATLDWHSWITGRPVNPKLMNKKLIVWMDGNTASASEILAAALADCASATLVGSQSYGKGIGQVIISRNSRDYLSITYLQLRGVSERIGNYHGVGINPDIEINDLTEIVRLVEPSYQGSFYSYSFPSALYKTTMPACYKIVSEDSIFGR